jgi:hypothetical protein
MTSTEAEPRINSRAAAALAGVTTQTVRTWIQTGRLDGGRVGSRYYTTAAAVAGMLQIFPRAGQVGGPRPNRADELAAATLEARWRGRKGK